MITLIAALDRGSVIGSSGRMPWHLPDDLAFFKAKTKGRPVIMGRRTLESIGRPLPGRHNIVITRRGVEMEGVTVCRDVDAALNEAKRAPGGDEIMVIGGGEVYRQTLDLAETLYLTHVVANRRGEVYFPPLDRGLWQPVWRRFHPVDRRHAFAFEWVCWRRRPPQGNGLARMTSGPKVAARA
ncbi:MAG: dihydrofolate reductase [Candidatus Competibacterales bacterium]